MKRDEILHQHAWKADLRLDFERRVQGTVLAHCRHEGPLRVQKALYPEGRDLCQAIILHPPSGIVGGDVLQIEAHVGPQAQVQLTTPGAGKTYGSAGPYATQRIELTVESGATLEWLPQETIVFDAARIKLSTHVHLTGDSAFLGWDIYCLGRAASGERFDQGHVSMAYRLSRDGQPLWVERGQFSGSDPLLGSPVGLATHTVCGTLMLAYSDIEAQAASLVAQCRETAPIGDAQFGVTVLPGLLLVRYLGNHSEAVRQWFTTIWSVLRPAYLGREAVPPRIWNT